MGSVTSQINCPKCKTEDVFHTEYNYRSNEEWGVCNHCGYTYSRLIERNADRTAVYKEMDRVNKADLLIAKINEGSKRDADGCYDWFDLTDVEKITLPENEINKAIGTLMYKEDKFLFVEKEDRAYRLSYSDCKFHWDGDELVSEALSYIDKKYGGFGIIHIIKGNVGQVISLNEGETVDSFLKNNNIPLDDVAFATEMQDGKIVVVKEFVRENEECNSDEEEWREVEEE